MLKRLKLRFTLIVTGLFMCVLLSVLVTMYIMMYKFSEAQSLDLLRIAAKSDGIRDPRLPSVRFDNGSPIVSDPSKEPAFPLEFAENRFLSETISVKYSPDGVIFDIVSQMETETDPAFLNETMLVSLILSEKEQGLAEFDGVSYRWLRQDKSYGGIIVLVNRVSEIETLRRLLVTSLFIAIGGFTVSAVMGWFLAAWAAKPIADAWEKQKRFIADASHEIKTPLTVMGANLDVVESNQNESVESQSKWLGYIRSETQRMRRLTDELLILARLDADEKTIQPKKKERFNLSDAVTEVCLPFESVIYEAEKFFTSDIDENILFNGSEDELKQIAVIFLDNAIKNSYKGTEIKLSLKRHKNEIILSCSDEGLYIPPEQWLKIFGRFYRADDSRASSTGGSGLGLAITHDIVLRHGGKITVNSIENGRTEFTVILPQIK